MSDILVRNLNPEAVKRLKARAKRHGRSLQSEAKLLLERAAGTTSRDIDTLISRWRKQFSGRQFSSSADLVREDRER